LVVAVVGFRTERRGDAGFPQGAFEHFRQHRLKCRRAPFVALNTPCTHIAVSKRCRICEPHLLDHGRRRELQDLTAAFVISVLSFLEDMRGGNGHHRVTKKTSFRPDSTACLFFSHKISTHPHTDTPTHPPDERRSNRVPKSWIEWHVWETAAPRLCPSRRYARTQSETRS
jgi:hypothetical protein